MPKMTKQYSVNGAKSVKAKARKTAAQKQRSLKKAELKARAAKKSKVVFDNVKSFKRPAGNKIPMTALMRSHAKYASKQRKSLGDKP